MANSGYFHRPPPAVIDKISQLNWPLLITLCLLAGVGLAAQYSVAGGSWSPWAERHALRFLIGLGMLIVIGLVPLRLWLKAAWPAYAIALMMLALVPVMGTEALGARRWLSLGPLSFQPSELMKVAIVIALAAYFHVLPADRVSRPVWLAIPIAMIALPMALVMKQPDLGTSLMLGMIGCGILLMAGVHLLYFASGAAVVLGGVPLAMPYLHDYQRRRIEAFLDPASDPLGSGYHIMQSKIALGSGGPTGRGFLGGTQSQLDFLPEKHTDFIFTTIGEEWGFIGSLFVLMLFGLLILVLFGMALQTASRFGRLVVSGSMLMVFGYAAINVGMVSGSLPVVGVPLPFISYGGTSMMTLLFGLGIAMSAYVHRGDAMRELEPPV